MGQASSHSRVQFILLAIGFLQVLDHVRIYVGKT